MITTSVTCADRTRCMPPQACRFRWTMPVEICSHSCADRASNLTNLVEPTSTATRFRTSHGLGVLTAKTAAQRIISSTIIATMYCNTKPLQHWPRTLFREGCPHSACMVSESIRRQLGRLPSSIGPATQSATLLLFENTAYGSTKFIKDIPSWSRRPARGWCCDAML